MVKIRLRRTGCKNHAAYRIVAADERSPRDGKFLEILGWYDTLSRITTSSSMSSVSIIGSARAPSPPRRLRP